MRYLKNNAKEFPDIKTKNNIIQLINTTVDKLDGNINPQMITLGNIIYIKKLLNDPIEDLYKTKFRHKNNIKLYLANSDGWNEIKPSLIHLAAKTPPLLSGFEILETSKYNNNNPDRINKIVDKLVKYL